MLSCRRWKAACFHRWSKFSLMMTDVREAHGRLIEFRQRATVVKWQAVAVEAVKSSGFRRAAAVLLRSKCRRWYGYRCSSAMRRWRAVTIENAQAMAHLQQSQLLALGRFRNILSQWQRKRALVGFHRLYKRTVEYGHLKATVRNLGSRLQGVIDRSRLGGLARVFTVLCGAVARHRAELRRILTIKKRSLERLRSATLRLQAAGLSTWRRTLVYESQLAMGSKQLATCIAKFNASQVACAFRQWVGGNAWSSIRAGKQAHAINMVVNSLRTLIRRQFAVAWRTWRRYADYAKMQDMAARHATLQLTRVLLRLQHKHCATAWSVWKCTVRGSNETRSAFAKADQVMRRLIKRQRNKSLAAGWRTWNEYVASSLLRIADFRRGQDIVGNVFRRMKGANLLVAWRTWMRIVTLARKTIADFERAHTVANNMLRRLQFAQRGMALQTWKWVVEDERRLFGELKHAQVSPFVVQRWSARQILDSATPRHTLTHLHTLNRIFVGGCSRGSTTCRSLTRGSNGGPRCAKFWQWSKTLHGLKTCSNWWRDA